MALTFCENLSEIRRKNGISQRKAAIDLKISQALLSHYETGAREPGLAFVCRACDYYGVSADALLCRDFSVAENSPVLEKYLALCEQKLSLLVQPEPDYKKIIKLSAEIAKLEAEIVF